MISRSLARAGAFAGRIGRDTAGNTLAIVGIAMIPLSAMIGSGVDMSRGYMARERLQVACDAGALAGRRAMSQGVVDDTVRTEALKFFRFNFPTGTAGVLNTAAYGAKGFTPVVAAATDSASTVVITASTTIPTSVMKMFGFTTLPLEVTCNAKQDFVNTDIVLVLDTTGSMDDSISGTKKIVSLRAAVLALYDELAPVQTQLQNSGLRLRYGIVPYSSGVNIGKQLREMSASYVVSDNWTYQSRQANWATSGVETEDDSISQTDCNLYGNNYGSNPATVSGNTYTYAFLDWGAVSDTSGTNRTCRRSWTSSQPVFNGWTYQPVSYDVSQYVLGNSVTTQTGSNGANVTSTWAGCIEERDTVTTITTTTTTIPSGAKDLDVNLIPTDNATRWRPYWPEVVYMPNSGQPQVACPAQAKRLQTWTRADLSTYLNLLVPTGGTYHDNGMRWGARLISSGGVFGPDNPTSYNNMPVSKHIIFMTDGIIDTGNTLYSAYGMEYWDRRVTGGWTSDADQTGRHDQRFKMMCGATKGMGVSIWVVAFASSLTSSLSACATNAAQASLSSNSTELSAKFVQIGKNIGSLRLTQ